MCDHARFFLCASIPHDYVSLIYLEITNKKVFTLFVVDYNNAQDLTDNNDDVTKITFFHSEFLITTKIFLCNTIKTCFKMTARPIKDAIDLAG